eukprot:TRINITY_DN4291_c0_g1_i2.p1 TRINITY_DN4291_c0_g1~~TRINITY_DN4291_c0_g1_i2.p1  ORF type:complete len:325 (-),score=44.84 TRINITY_DN4291_c0_g1_i2:172-1146(-)
MQLCLLSIILNQYLIIVSPSGFVMGNSICQQISTWLLFMRNNQPAILRQEVVQEIDGVYHVSKEVWHKIRSVTVNQDTADNLQQMMELREQVLEVIPEFADKVLKGAMKTVMQPKVIKDVMEVAKMLPWVGSVLNLSAVIFMGVFDVYENKENFKKLNEFIASVLETLSQAPAEKLKLFFKANDNVNEQISVKFQAYLVRGVKLVERFTKRSKLWAFVVRERDEYDFQMVQQGLNSTLLLILLNMQMMPPIQQQPAIQTNNNTSEQVKEKITKLGGKGGYEKGLEILSDYVKDPKAPKNSSIDEILELMPYKILEGQEYTPRGS